MALKFESVVAAEIGSIVSIVVGPGSTSESTEYELRVPLGAQLLIASVSDAGPQGLLRGPKNVEVRLTSPSNKDYTDSFTPWREGQRTLHLSNPEAGVWKLTIFAKAEASAEVTAGALKPGWRKALSKSSKWFGCATCKLVIRAAAVAIVGAICPAAGSAIAADLAVAALRSANPDLYEKLIELLGSGDDVLKLIGVIGSYASEIADKVLTEACKVLRLCD